jgi:hypothetical protein
MRPEKILPWLLGAAVGAAGLIQGMHWRTTAPAADSGEAESRIVALESEVALLKRENESLRSLAQGGGDFHVDPALIDFTEESLGMDFKSNPLVHQIAGEELRDRIVASLESRYGPHGLDSRQQAWIFMGLLNADDRFAPQLAATKSVGARSWFDEQSGEAWVTDRFDPQAVPDQAALIRALGRILLHQHYPPAPGWPGDDAAMAREAIHHGAAMAAENRFLARQALATGFTGLQENAEARELMDSLPPFVRGLATFPSTLGLPRASRLMDQEEILSALHKPPATTADFYPDHEGIESNPPGLPETPGNTLLDESIGMLGLKLWLEPLGEEFPKIGDGWRGDHYRLFATNDVASHLVWDLRFDSAKTADAFLAAAGEMISALAGSEKPPTTGEIITTPEDRFIALARPAPDTVRFIHTADRATAEALIR